MYFILLSPDVLFAVVRQDKWFSIKSANDNRSKLS